MWEVAVEAHHLAGGTHLGSEQNVDGLADRGAEALERQHRLLHGDLLAEAHIAAIAIRQQQAVLTLLLNRLACHDAGRGLR